MRRRQEPKGEIKSHEILGPYVLTDAGVQSKYADERVEMVIAYNQMTSRGESVVVPSMSVALTPDGDASAYAPMELGGFFRSRRKPRKSTGRPAIHAPCARGRFRSRKRTGPSRRSGWGKRRRDVSAYCRTYRMMRQFGFRWAKADYGWIKGRLPDYNLGRTQGYSEKGPLFETPRFARRRDSYIFRR